LEANGPVSNLIGGVPVITFNQKGSFESITKYLTKTKTAFKPGELDKYGQAGVQALMSATPVDSGETAAAWSYSIKITKGKAAISFYNENIQNGVNIAVILQYGHATRSGGWIEGRDYINPVIAPLFDNIVDAAWKEVTKV